MTWYLQVAKWDGRWRRNQLQGVRIGHLMPTLEQAKKVHGNRMIAELEGAGDWAFLGAKINKTDWRITFPGGSWIQWLTAERIDNARGIRCDVLTIDECDDIDPEDVDAVTVPMFSEPESLRMMLLGGTPRRGRYGLLYKAHRHWPAQLSNSYSFHATAYDAPELVDPTYLEEVRQTTPPEVFKREWECDFDAAEGLVYPIFSEATHVRVPPEGTVWTEIVYGADHGFEDPGVILTLGVIGSGKDAVIWVLDEVYRRHEQAPFWEARVVERIRDYPNAKWYADPSRADIIARWRALHARMQDTNNDRDEGVESVAYRLVVRRGGPQLYVHPRCVNTIAEFGMYRRKRDPRNKERVLDEIDDSKNDHAMDALRYAIHSRFPPPAGRGRNRVQHDDRLTAA